MCLQVQVSADAHCVGADSTVIVLWIVFSWGAVFDITDLLIDPWH